MRRQFALVDASFCFVAKHHAAPRVHSILRVANSFGSMQLTRDDLIKLSAVAPELVILSRPTSTLQIGTKQKMVFILGVNYFNLGIWVLCTCIFQ